MVDEAHATGVFGKNGAGLVEEMGLTGRIDFIMGTFSKALGSFGAYFSGSKETVDYLINTARGFIYSTALPPAVIAANLAALELLEKEPFRRRTLIENAAFFRDGLAERGLAVTGRSQIVPLTVGASEKAVALSEHLESKGYWALPIRPPTVPADRARIRFSLSYNHNKEILQQLIEIISNS